MYKQVEKPQENKSRAVANSSAQKKSNMKQGFGFVDNRPEAIAKRKLSSTMNNSLQEKQAAHMKSNKTGNYFDLKQHPVQKKDKSGLPDNLKSGIENISGLVHRNLNYRSVQMMIEENKPREGAYARVENYGDNWATLDRNQYIKKYKLKQNKATWKPGKYIQQFMDGSIILTDLTGQYWRHEDGSIQNAYYDANHQINGNDALTHFWISEKQKSKIQKTVQLKDL